MSDAVTPILRIDDAHVQHVVIRASAGSGKTHALSGRYLSLLAAGVEPARILATTFTRAAAGEIRDRLLNRLARSAEAKSAESDRARAGLAASLGVKTVSAAEALAMLVRLARLLHTLQIRTLDSFFAGVVQGFAIELGLPAECGVIDEDDDRSLRHEATRLMLDERDPQTLIEVLRLLTRGDADRGVTETIDRTISALHELWREAPPEAWQWMPEPQGLLSRTDLIDAIDALANCGIPQDKNFAKARQKSVEYAQAGDWRSFLDGGLGGKVAANDLTYSKKSIDGDLLSALRPLVRHASAELLHSAREQTLATSALLRLFDEHYARLKRRQRAITFADLTHVMRGAKTLGTLEDIGYRLDARIHHLLLDEFQDTSSAQWQALQAMCEEVAGQHPPRRSFFCVGDVKQSIYGWRGAQPEILDRMPTLLPGVATQPLDRSYRSSLVVIDAVNAVFADLPSNDALQGDASHIAAAQAWHAAFSKHDVAESLKNAPGYVEMRTIAPGLDDKAPERKQARLRMAADIAAELHRRDPRMSIALLTRTNASVARLLYELGPAGRGVPVSGRGGGPLIDAPPVNAILDLLQLADHPDDTVAAFNVAASPLGGALGFARFDHDVERWRLSRQTRRDLVLRGYQPMIARWVALIAPECDVRERRRAAQLVELAGVHDAGSSDGGLRTKPFIDLVENRDVPDSQPAPIEVMTIHQAKGLEFDAVILAELNGRLRGPKEPMVVFDRDFDTGRISRIARYPNKESQNLSPELTELAAITRTRAVRESLSVLYVAMTRAKHGVYMVIDPKADNEKTWPATATGVLRGALASDACEPDAIVHYQGDAGWVEMVRAERLKKGGKQPEQGVMADAPATIRFASEGVDAPSTDTAVSPSAARERMLARAKASSLRDSLRLTNPEGRERGSVIHALFERIEWLEEFSADDAALLAAMKVIAPRRDDAWHRRQIAAFRGMLAKPPIAAALSRGSIRPGSLRVLREFPFVRLQGGGIQSGSIDRLTLRMNSSGTIESATVIDFKTDAIVEASARAQAETHREQLEAYREVVAAQFALPAKFIAMQVLLVGAGEAVAL